MIVVRASRLEELSRFTAFETESEASPFVGTYPLAEHVRLLALDHVTYLSIDDGGELVGFLILVLDPDGVSVELRRIVVARRDRGIGQVVLGEVVRYCEVHFPRTRLWLDVARYNARAKHVYGKLGFVPFEGQPQPGADEDLEFMERSLRPDR